MPVYGGALHMHCINFRPHWPLGLHSLLREQKFTLFHSELVELIRCSLKVNFVH